MSNTATIKRDDKKQKWEESEFPLVCETCLGDNPYIRMTKEPFGKSCQICETPFTVFSWQAGTKGRLKRVEICQNCARTKNVCQVCIFDLQYGLPVQVRDSILKESGGGVGSSAGAMVPQSDANRAWFTQAQARAVDQGTAGAISGSMEATLKLQEAAKMAPQYDRNLAKLCTFYARGECNRGSRCPFRHEMPRDRNDPLNKQSTKSRFYGINDPLAAKVMGGIKAREEKLIEELGDDKTTTLYVGFNFSENAAKAQITEMDIRDSFYSFGEIISVRMKKDGDGAFVEFSTREATSLAIAAMNRKSIQGVPIYVNWARSPKRGGVEGGLDLLSDQIASPAGGPNRETTGTSKNIPVASLPPGGMKKNIVVPSGFVPVTSSSIKSGLGIPRPAGARGVPRPGGGPIRRAGIGPSVAPKPYYPSADPKMFGSQPAQSS